jgi:hypothetical protein
MMKSLAATISSLWNRVLPWLRPEYLIRAFLLLEIMTGLNEGNWTPAFIATATLILTFLPAIFARRWQIHVPPSFVSAIIVFTFATLFMGEVWDYYERFWWWDLVLHGSSAIGFGLIGFLFIFLMFQGNRHNAPPLSVAVISFTFALSIGALWEIFEFAMDKSFGMTMQKSGLGDTMYDLIVDTFGAALGALAGYLYLKGQLGGGLRQLIEEAVSRNRRIFRRQGPKGGGQ